LAWSALDRQWVNAILAGLARPNEFYPENFSIGVEVSDAHLATSSLDRLVHLNSVIA
jgi:hypothetical protein